MKTKQILVIASLLASVSVGCAADKPEAQITFRLIDENHAPLANVPVHVVTLDHVAPGAGFGDSIYKETNVLTDIKGLAGITWTSADGQFSYNVKNLPNYYEGGGLYRFESQLAGQWQPWDASVVLVLKPIVNPVPMYAKQAELTIPKFNTPVGYDLMVGDWTSPYGKGKISDLIFQFDCAPTAWVTNWYGNSPRPQALHDNKLTIGFSNKQDGIQPVVLPKDNQSALVLPRQAPADGYEPNITKHDYDQITGKQKQNTTIQHRADFREDQGYFFRIRAVDQDGKIVSARYGKMGGDFRFWADGKIRFGYYLNPEVNSRNVEFDPKRNLFVNLKEFEQVSAP